MSTNSYRPVALRMYRILLKQCRTLRQTAVVPSDSNMILLQTRLDPHANGISQIYTARTPASPQESRESLYRFFMTTEYASGDDDDHDDLDLHDWLEDLLGGWYHTLGVPPPRSLWTNRESLHDSMRHAFRNAPPPVQNDDDDDATRRQHSAAALYTQWSIGLYKLLQQQAAVSQTTSVSTEHGVRVVATSQCIGRSLHHHIVRATTIRRGSSSSGRQHKRLAQVVADSDTDDDDDDDDDLLATKFRFAYRIRVENNSDTDTIQLLGRTWHIQETSPTGVPLGDPIRVHAPKTGAVGKLPVLHPGQVFEYSSQCELVTPTGEMKGCFYFCGKIPPTTMSSNVGVQVDAFDRPEDCFEVTVQPFHLLADE